MRRSSNEMQVNVAGIRRNLKNFAHNYSDAQKKVREATSNDPWGPSSTIMAEIADLTYNVVAFSEIMQMVWKRLNDHGRNWRHVYKALVLLDYLIKTGSEKVGQQCKENIFAIQTLKDFTYMEEGKDQGQNVREKAKQLVNLLKDDERLKNERARALKAKERFAQSSSGFGSDGGLDTPSSPKFPAFRGEWAASRDSADLPRDIEVARPQTAGEEELQLQLALAMSREEAEQEEQKRKSDDVRLQLALSQSQHDFKTTQDPKPSHMVDLLDVALGEGAAPSAVVDPWGMPQPPRPQQSSPWKSTSLSPPSHHQDQPVVADPWAPPVSKQQPNPWVPGTVPKPADPWSPTSQGSTDLDEFDVITNRNRDGGPTTTTGSPVKTNGSTDGSGNDPFELNLLGDALPSTKMDTSTTKKTPLSFLGENSALVNLDNLVTTTVKPTNTTLAANPFSTESATVPNPSRPVFNTPPPKPSINEMKQQQFAPFAAPQASAPAAPRQGAFDAFGTNGTSVPDPWTPLGNQQTNSNGGGNPWTKGNETANPFLS